MKSRMILVMILSGLSSALPVLASEDTRTGASTAARWLNVAPGARPAAMGGAFTAMADDVYGPSYNPAGLSEISSASLALGHQTWVGDASFERIALASSAGQGKGWALGFDYINMGTYEQFVLQNGAPISKGDTRPYGAGLTASYGQSLFGGFSLGASAKALMQDLAGDRGMAAAMDLGARWSSPVKGLNAGLGLRNFGSQLSGADLPQRIAGGLAYTLGMGSGRSASLLADAILAPREGSNETRALAGAEVHLAAPLALRAGWQFGAEGSPTGFTGGLGVKLGFLGLDYAYSAAGSLAGSHQMALTADLGSFSSAPAAQAAPEAIKPKAEPLEAKVNDYVQMLKQRDWENARATAATLYQKDPQAALQQAQVSQVEEVQPAVFEGRLEEVEHILTAQRELNPQDSYVYQALSTIQWHLGKTADSKLNLLKASQLAPEKDYLKVMLKNRK
jgi:hypothetical protein